MLYNSCWPLGCRSGSWNKIWAPTNGVYQTLESLGSILDPKRQTEELTKLERGNDCSLGICCYNRVLVNKLIEVWPMKKIVRLPGVPINPKCGILGRRHAWWHHWGTYNLHVAPFYWCFGYHVQWRCTGTGRTKDYPQGLHTYKLIWFWPMPAYLEVDGGHVHV